jgi:hypothetical protein
MSFKRKFSQNAESEILIERSMFEWTASRFCYTCLLARAFYLFNESIVLSPHFVTNSIFSLLQHLSFPDLPFSHLKAMGTLVNSF